MTEDTNETLVDSAFAVVRDVMPEGARGCAAPWARGAGTARHVLRGLGRTLSSAHRNRRARPLPGGRLDRDQLPATIESAVASGHAAARAAARHLSL